MLMTDETWHSRSGRQSRAEGGRTVTRGHRLRVGSTVLFILVTLAGVGWATDGIRLDNVRAIYTAKCAPGTWEGNRCYGRLVAGPRYSFQASEARREVRFWIDEAPAAVGRYSECRITDGANWSCNAKAEAASTIAHEMVHGHPVPDRSVPTLPFHEIEKWRWLLLRMGFPVGHDAL